MSPRAFRWLLLGGGLTALAILVPQAFSSLGVGADPVYSRTYQRLLDSLEGTRPIEARVTGESAYEPYRPAVPSADPIPPASATRGEVDLPHPQVPTKIARALEQAALRDPSPDNWAALAILHLVEGRPTVAVPLLREARARKPDDPRILGDLAAALLVVSRRIGDPWLTLEAIDAARESLRLKPSLPALFNLALALEQGGLRNQAMAAWQQYREEDSRSEWAGEAALRLDRLEQAASVDRAISRSGLDFPALPQNSWATRQRGERLLLTRWAEQTLVGRKPAAEAALAEAETLASTLPAGGGRLLAASVAAIREAEQAGDRVRIARLAHGHQRFGRALVLARQEHKQSALSWVDGAIQDLRAAGSPFELRARVLRALYAAEPNWAELQQLERVGEERGFPSIVAEERFIAAHRISLEGRLEAAAEVYRDARRRFEELDEREMSAVMNVMLAELLV